MLLTQKGRLHANINQENEHGAIDVLFHHNIEGFGRTMNWMMPALSPRSFASLGLQQPTPFQLFGSFCYKPRETLTTNTPMIMTSS